MQAQAPRATPNSAGSVVSVTGALRAVESLLLRGGHQTARRNAWTAVLEDRKRARDRREAEHVLDALSMTRNAGPGAR